MGNMRNPLQTELHLRRPWPTSAIGPSQTGLDPMMMMMMKKSWNEDERDSDDLSKGKEDQISEFSKYFGFCHLGSVNLESAS